MSLEKTSLKLSPNSVENIERIDIDKIEVDSVQAKLIIAKSIVAAKVVSFFDIDINDIELSNGTFKFVIDNVVIVLRFLYDKSLDKFSFETLVSLYDPSLSSREWLIVYTPHINSLTQEKAAFYFKQKTFIEHNDMLRTFIGVSNLIKSQQKAVDSFLEIHHKMIDDMRFRIRLFALGAIGGVSSFFLTDNTEDFLHLLVVMGGASFITVLAKMISRD